MTSLRTRLSVAGLVAVFALSLGACQRRDETAPAGGPTGSADPGTSTTSPAGGSGMGSGTATAPDAAASAASNP